MARLVRSMISWGVLSRRRARLAEQAHVGRLIVSHIGLIGPALDAAIAELKKSYSGLLSIGADLQCTPIAE